MKSKNAIESLRDLSSPHNALKSPVDKIYIDFNKAMSDSGSDIFSQASVSVIKNKRKSAAKS